MSELEEDDSAAMGVANKIVAQITARLSVVLETQFSKSEENLKDKLHTVNSQTRSSHCRHGH